MTRIQILQFFYNIGAINQSLPIRKGKNGSGLTLASILPPTYLNNSTLNSPDRKKAYMKLRALVSTG